MTPKCILPWVYLEIDPSGNVVPCCVNCYSLGNIKTLSLEEIWNGDKMNQFRLSLLKEELPSTCDACKKNEELGKESVRMQYNDFFKNSLLESLENTNQDGSLKIIKFKGYRFRVSNKCNFKCRMCCPELSSSFTGEILEHAEDLNIDEFVDNNLEHLELIGFTGGETLIIDEHYKLLQKLIDKGKTDIELIYNTNMSTLKYKSYDVLEYWNKWNPKKLMVIASIDEIGDRAEYIRKGTKWSVVDKNLKLISKQSFTRGIQTVVSCFNVFRLPEIMEYLTDIEYIIPIQLLEKQYLYEFNFVDPGESESHLSISILPEKFKEKIKRKLICFVNNYNLKYNTDITPIFNPVLEHLNEKSNPQIIKKFLYKNIKMDNERQENLFKTIPEFIEIVDEWKSSGLI